MIIKEVIDVARYSELAGTSAKDNQEAIVAFLNMGMLELYTRFPLRVEEHVIELQEGEVYYSMPADFMYPLAAYGEATEQDHDTVKQLSINNEDDPYSIFFVDWNTAQIPVVHDDSFVSIMYGAKPAPITLEQATDGTTELDLPDALVDALLSYLGYRAHLGVRGDSQSENNAHWIRFDRNCRVAIELGVGAPQDSINMGARITDRGFV